MMMMAEGILGTSSVIEGVTVKADTNVHQDNLHAYNNQGHEPYTTPLELSKEEVVETVPQIFSSDSAACANCSISFFDPVGNEVFQRIFFMCLDSDSNEAIQISSVIHILFARKLAGCTKPSVDLALCSKCAELVARMYQIYRELDELSTVNAYINSFLSHIIHAGRKNTAPAPPLSYYEESTSTAVSGPSTNHQDRAQQSYSSAPRAARVPSSEPPPLTYPSYFVSNHSYVQDFSNSVDLGIVNSKEAQFQSQNTIQKYADYLSHSQQQHLHQLQQQQILEQQHAHAQNQHHILQQQLLQTQLLKKQAQEAQQQRYEIQQQQQEQQPLHYQLHAQTQQGQEQAQAQDLKRKKKNKKIESMVTEENSGVSLPEKKVKTVSCPVEGCFKTYKGKGAKASLRNHTKIVHLKQFPYACNICLKPIASRHMLENHTRTHLGTEEKLADQLSSPQALQTVSSADPQIFLSEGSSAAIALSLPVSAPEPPPKTICPQCDKPLSSPYQLRVHLARVHGTGGTAKLFHCEVNNCARKFKDKSSLRRHDLRIHQQQPSGGAPPPPATDATALSHFCRKCGTAFRTKKTLKEHSNTCKREDTRQFACSFPSCTRRFKMKHHLQCHISFQHNGTVRTLSEHPEGGAGWTAKASVELEMDQSNGKAENEIPDCSTGLPLENASAYQNSLPPVGGVITENPNVMARQMPSPNPCILPPPENTNLNGTPTDFTIN